MKSKMNGFVKILLCAVAAAFVFAACTPIEGDIDEVREKAKGLERTDG